MVCEKMGKMTTNYVFNSVLGQDPQTVIPTLFTEVKEVTNDAGGSWANGKVYEYESDFGVFGKLDGLEYTSLRTMLTSIGETKYPNFVFAYLMRQAELFCYYRRCTCLGLQIGRTSYRVHSDK